MQCKYCKYWQWGVNGSNEEGKVCKLQPCGEVAMLGTGRMMYRHKYSEDSCNVNSERHKADNL